MTQRQILYIIIGICSVWHASAATPDSARVERSSLWHGLKKVSRQNPAFMVDAFRMSRSELFLQADFASEKQPFVVQEGDGYLLPQAQVNTYLKTSARSAVWGEASYMNGQQYDIRWNSTADHALLAPYVLADSVGGNTRRERYVLSGGYAIRLNRWTVGGDLHFRAEQEYRNVDPRMRGVITDLTLKAGAAYDMTSYRLGLAAEVNIYKQTNDVDFYDELGGPAEYIMTGLGTDYSRFSGTNTDIYFEGSGSSLLLSLQPLYNKGIFADMQLAAYRYECISDEYNSLPLTTLYTDKAVLTAGWKHEDKSHWALYGRLSLLRKRGDEHVAGDAVGGVYPVLADLTLYNLNLTQTSIAALYGGKRPFVWNIEATVGYQDYEERYVYPERRQTATHLLGMLQGQIMLAPTDRLTLDCSLLASHHAALRSDILMPYTEMKQTITDMVNHNYSQLQASYTHIEARLRADYRLSNSRYGLFAALGGGTTFNNVSNNRLQLHVSAGITF